MAKDIDAVIAALRVLLDEAEKNGDTFWKIAKVNDWIARLPGAWRGRWRRLELQSRLPRRRCQSCERHHPHQSYPRLSGKLSRRSAAAWLPVVAILARRRQTRPKAKAERRPDARKQASALEGFAR